MPPNKKNVIEPDLDAVDASPVQIPKKFVVIPALSLALHSLPAKVTHASLQKLPEIVTIPIQSIDPPHIQEPTRDKLSVPTIRLRLNYEAIPIKFSYLMDVENCSSEDELRSHTELLTEHRRRRRRLSRKIKELAAKDESQKSRKSEEQYSRDDIDQKKITSEFTDKDSHNMFREDLRTETLTHQISAT